MATDNVARGLAAHALSVAVAGGGEGVCLPVVELSTAIANGSTLTKEENAKLTAAFETGMPIVLKTALQSIGDGISADSFIGVAHRAISNGVMMFVLPFSQLFLLLSTDGLSWFCEVE